MLLTLVVTETTKAKQIKTLKKVLIWRVVSVSLTYLVTFLMTGDLKSATWFTIFLHIVLMVANYIFEIIWDRINDSFSEQSTDS